MSSVNVLCEMCRDFADKKLCYRRRTVRRAVSVEILSTAQLLEQVVTTNAEQIDKIMQIENYGRPTCYKLCTSSKFASILVAVIHKLHRRRVLLTTRLICRGESLYFQSLGQNALEKYPYFRRYPNFLITQHRQGSSRAKNQFNSFIRFDRTPTSDGRTGNYFSFGIIIVRLRCGYWFCTVRQKKRNQFSFACIFLIRDRKW